MTKSKAEAWYYPSLEGADILVPDVSCGTSASLRHLLVTTRAYSSLSVARVLIHSAAGIGVFDEGSEELPTFMIMI